MISSIKTFKYFQDGYSFLRSPHVLFPNIAFSPSVIWNLIKYKVNLIIWNRHAIFKIAAIFQHHWHMPCMCICICLCTYICIRMRIRVRVGVGVGIGIGIGIGIVIFLFIPKTEERNTGKNGAWTWTSLFPLAYYWIWILEDVVASSYI